MIKTFYLKIYFCRNFADNKDIFYHQVLLNTYQAPLNTDFDYENRSKLKET